MLRFVRIKPIGLCHLALCIGLAQQSRVAVEVVGDLGGLAFFDLFGNAPAQWVVAVVGFDVRGAVAFGLAGVANQPFCAVVVVGFFACRLLINIKKIYLFHLNTVIMHLPLNSYRLNLIQNYYHRQIYLQSFFNFLT
ncbi:hypothetical protein [Delftia sp. PS-11]|uniref:hypothetical protein n=1 Tax=Delftia sp. PS-11 TaxID=2767222 RepID=UPI003AB5672D